MMLVYQSNCHCVMLVSCGSRRYAILLYRISYHYGMLVFQNDCHNVILLLCIRVCMMSLPYVGSLCDVGVPQNCINVMLLS